MMIRLELLTPAGDLTSSETPTTRCSRMHGVVMVFFFLIPSIPAVLGNFLMPIMIGAKDLAFPRINLLSWYIFMLGGIFTMVAALSGGVDTGWTFYTPYSHRGRRTRTCHDRGARRVHHRVLVDPHRPELHRHHPQDARAGTDLVPAAALRLGALRDQPDHDPRHAGHRDHACCCWRSSAPCTSASSIRRSAATRCCSSTCSGSTRTRPSTS